MIVNRLLLENIGPHEHRDQEFQTGLIGIFGANGTGKTTLMNSIYAGLTNDFSRLASSRDLAIRDTSAAKDIASVTLFCTHADKEFELRRSLRPNKGWLILDGHKYTKVVDIRNQLEELLNVQEDVIGDYLFVNQWEMFSFISQKPAERAEAFQHLCRTDRCADIWKYLGEAITELGDVTSLDSDDNRKELRDRISETQREQDEADEQVALHQEDLLGDKALAKARKCIAEKEQQDGIAKQLTKARELHTRAEKGHERNKKDYKKAKATNTEVEAALVGMTEEYEEAIDGADLYHNWKEYVKKKTKWTLPLESAQKSIDALTEPVEPENYDYQVIRHFDESRAELLVKINLVNETLESLERLGADAECSTCGQKVAKDYVEAMRSKVTSWERGRKDFLEDPAYVATLAYNKQLEEYQDCFNTHKYVVDQNQDKIDQLEVEAKPKVAEDAEAWAETVETYENLEKAYQTDCTELQSLKTAVAIGETRAEERKATLDGLVAQAAELNVSDSDYEFSIKRIGEHNAASEEIAAWQAKVELFNEKKIEYDTELQRKTRLIKRAAKGRKLSEFFTQLRDVSHRDNWPRIVSEIHLHRMRELINDTLDSFGQPFIVRPGDKLSLQFRKPGAPWREASLLSGGEKMILAMAFRRALNSLFSVDIGILSLDEPTAGVDVHNVQHLREALTVIGSDTERRQGQVFVVTHEQELMPCFNQVITL